MRQVWEGQFVNDKWITRINIYPEKKKESFDGLTEYRHVVINMLNTQSDLDRRLTIEEFNKYMVPFLKAVCWGKNLDNIESVK